MCVWDSQQAASNPVEVWADPFGEYYRFIVVNKCVCNTITDWLVRRTNWLFFKSSEKLKSSNTVLFFCQLSLFPLRLNFFNTPTPICFNFNRARSRCDCTGLIFVGFYLFLTSNRKILKTNERKRLNTVCLQQFRCSCSLLAQNIS